MVCIFTYLSTLVFFTEKSKVIQVRNRSPIVYGHDGRLSSSNEKNTLLSISAMRFFSSFYIPRVYNG